MRIDAARWLSRERLCQAAVAGLLGVALVVAGHAGARAADDEDDEIFEQKVIKNILGALGVNVGRDSTIDYHERSPLVIPPSRELPPPEATGSVNNPAWPVDPERKKKKPVNVDRRNPNETNETNARAQAEWQRGTAAAGTGRVTAPNPNANTDPGRPLKPSEMGDNGGSWIGSFNFNALLGYKQEEQGQFTGEPPRNSLTMPPVGYQTPSPQYPYGINPSNKPAKPLGNIMDRSAESGR